MFTKIQILLTELCHLTELLSSDQSFRKICSELYLEEDVFQRQRHVIRKMHASASLLVQLRKGPC